jgi:COMPASS component SWD3
MSDLPQPYDLVIGGNNAQPEGLPSAAILGGITAVKLNLASPDEHRRSQTLNQALTYGLAGIDLVIDCLDDHSRLVQKTAYNLLRHRRERKTQLAIANFNSYSFFECLRTFKVKSVVAISPDAKAIATRLTYGAVKVWQPLEKEKFYDLPPISGSFGLVCLSEGGDLCVRVLAKTRTGTSSTIELWQEGELISDLVGHNDTVTAIAFSPDGKTLATGSHDKSIKLWNTGSGKLICTFSHQLFAGSHRSPVVSLAFSNDSRWLYSGGNDMTIKMWDWQKRNSPQTLIAKTNSVNNLALTSDRSQLVSLGYGRNIQLWNAQTGKLQRSLEGHNAPINAIAISPNDKVLVSVGNDCSLKFWQLETGKNFCSLTQSSHSNYIEQVAFSSDGQSLITAGADNTIKLWGVAP